MYRLLDDLIVNSSKRFNATQSSFPSTENKMFYNKQLVSSYSTQRFSHIYKKQTQHM